LIMLFISVPLVPWALREATTVVVLTVALLTASLISVPGRFNPEAFWLLQMLVLGSVVVVGVLVSRNTAVRKQDIRTQFELDTARKEMRLLSLKDHLTGAWNRRYLETQFPAMAEECRENGQTLHVAVLDLDDFKGINDEYGHQLADQVLARLGSVFIQNLGSKGCLIRLGGDEFLILYQDDDLEDLIKRTVDELHYEPSIKEIARARTISLSAGFASAGPDEHADPKRLYMVADKALYSMKREREPIKPDDDLDDTINRTGRWDL
ncbi:MAG: GGDEF domain-containing protein, partial [Woeseiaceae bacterium]